MVLVRPADLTYKVCRNARAKFVGTLQNNGNFRMTVSQIHLRLVDSLS